MFGQFFLAILTFYVRIDNALYNLRREYYEVKKFKRN